LISLVFYAIHGVKSIEYRITGDKMKNCSICSAINELSNKYCHYCGYLIREDYYIAEDERYKKYCKTDNVESIDENRRLRISKIKRVENILVKRNILFDKIKIEKEKVNNISLALVTVSSITNREKIETVKSKMEELIEELVQCRIDMEFVKFVGNFKAIKAFISASNDLKVININEMLEKEQSQFIDWSEKLKAIYNSAKGREFIKQKEMMFLTLKEEIALRLITGILSTTSLLKNEIEQYNIDGGIMDIEKDIQRINYEIDRLNGELTLQ
jgi:hypothetical protein